MLLAAKKVADWCRRFRHRPVPEQQVTLKRKLLGHYAYYGRPGNYYCLSQFYRGVLRSWKQWLSRRSWHGNLTWDAFHKLLTRHQDYLTSAAVARTGTIAASGSFDKTVRLWDASAKGGIGVLTGHEAAVQAVALSPDGSLVASGGSDRSLRLWEVESRKLRVAMTGHNATIEAIAFSPQGDLIASGDAEGRLRLWKTDGTPSDSFDGRSPRIRSLAFLPEGQVLAAGGADGVVRLWNVADRSELGSVAAHKNTVYGLAIRQDGKLLASAGFDRTIRLWRLSVE